MVEIVLESTLYKDAAAALAEYHYKRNIKRRRIEVVDIEMRDMSDAAMLSRIEREGQSSRWNKSRIVQHLTDKHKIVPQTARVVASMVEEKVLEMGLTYIPRSLVRQIVLVEASAVLCAEEQLRTVIVKSSACEKKSADKEVCLR